MFKVFAPIALATLLSACASPSSTVSAPPPDLTAHSTSPWAGRYTGTLPCASCGGIDIVLTLNSDNTYDQSTLYQDNDKTPELSHGKLLWLADGSFVLEGEKTRWRAGADTLTMVDPQSGQATPGPLAEYYVLRRVTP